MHKPKPLPIDSRFRQIIPIILNIHGESHKSTYNMFDEWNLQPYMYSITLICYEKW